MVWICEYPYRTVRVDGPCEDCRCESVPSEARGAQVSLSSEAQSAKEKTQRIAGSRVLPFRDSK